MSCAPSGNSLALRSIPAEGQRYRRPDDSALSWVLRLVSRAAQPPAPLHNGLPKQVLDLRVHAPEFLRCQPLQLVPQILAYP